MAYEVFVEDRTSYIRKMKELRQGRVSMARKWCVKNNYILCNTFETYFLYKKHEKDFTNAITYLEVKKS